MTEEITKLDLKIGDSIIKNALNYQDVSKKKSEYLENLIQTHSETKIIRREQEIIDELKGEFLQSKYPTINLDFLKQSNEVQVRNQIILLPRYAVFSTNNSNPFTIRFEEKGIHDLECPRKYKEYIIKSTEFMNAELKYKKYSNYYDYRFPKTPAKLKQKYQKLNKKRFEVKFEKFLPTNIIKQLSFLQKSYEEQVGAHIITEVKPEDWNNENYQTKNAIIIFEGLTEPYYMETFNPIDIKLK
ncbi:MAG: hypothetical protein ABIC91_04480 [Nanoarchaeota archaeon]|nr:hypothetical protein [Nanoarchaeota archaeon]MBU1849767.1 hypothetical protein [Nanoarchaeota archaeon]